MVVDKCSTSKKESVTSGVISDDNIKVYVRVRPPDSYENKIDHKPCLEVTSQKTLTLFSKPEPKVFTYDQVADPNIIQEEVFTNAAKKIIDGCLEGYNGTIFAYGQTGSGKAFTMLGPVEQDNFNHDLRGVIPRGFEYLFNLINRENEKDPTSTGLQLREDIKKGVFVDGLLEKFVSSARDVYHVLNSGWLNRRVASTSMNRESSRSHAVFTITIESKETEGTINNIKVSRLHLVALAGSERQRDTQTEGLRLKEAGSINKSLSALRNVIMALVDITHGKQRHVPYRDSKLTFLLRDSLGGNARTHIIANVHPSARCFGETLSTLNFARRAKQIKNKAIVNEDTSCNVASLQEEIRKLKLLLQEARAGLNTVASSSKENQNGSLSQITPGSAENSWSQSPEGGPEDWKQMMLTAISMKEKSEQEKQALEEKVKKLEELCKKKEKFLQSTKMILKFRDAHIAKLQKMQKKNDNVITADDTGKELEILREEIKILEEKVEHHPDVTKFAMENLELRAELKALRSNTEAHYDLSYDLSKTRFYAMQLEHKLRDALNTPGSGDLEKSPSSSLQSLEASNAELERYKSELTQVQGHLESVKEELHQTREDLQQSKETLIEKEDSFRKKLLESDAEIESSKKTIAELQRTLETLQVKTAFERNTFNDVHMQAIRTLSTPRSFSTPSKKRPPHPMAHNTSSILDEQQPNGVLHTRRDSYNDLNEPELEESFCKYDPASPDDEEIYQETLLEELKQLQDMYNVVLEEKQNEEEQRIKLNEMKNKLEHQVQQLNEFLSCERVRFGGIETELNKKVIALNEQLKEGMLLITILKSENEDLKICLQQADRQIDSLKKDRDMHKINTGRKSAALESIICTLEIELSNTKSEMEQILEINQNFQTDVENMRDELQFKDHKLSEWENLLRGERDKIKSLENELESCLEKLHMVSEANEKLITEVDKQQQLIAALEQCVNLKDELQRNNILCEEQGEKIISLNKKLVESGELVSELKRQAEEEKSKIASLDGVIAEKKDNIEELTSDLGKKQNIIAKLKERLSDENEKREQERETFQNEIAALKDEITTTSEHCRELTRTLEEQQQQFGTLQCELKQKNDELFNLNNKIAEIAAMEPDVIQRHSDGGLETSFVNSSLLDQSQLQEMKKREVKVQNLLESYETTFREQAQDLENYKTKIKLLEEKTCFEDTAKDFQIQLENLRTEMKEKEVVNEFEVKQLKDRLAIAMSACDSANKLKDEAVQVKLETEKKLAEMSSRVLLAEEDCAANCDSVVRLTEKLKEYHKKEDEWNECFGREMEAKTKLQKAYKYLEQKLEKANADNSRLAGHQNIRQKIQYISDIKKDYQLLKEENQKLTAKYQKFLLERKEETRKPLTIKNENV